jgi:hypothetical protein
VDNPIPVANKSTLVDSLLRVIAASFGDLPHSLNHSKVGDPQDTGNGRVGGLNRGLRLLTLADIAARKVPQCLPPRNEKALVFPAHFLVRMRRLRSLGRRRKQILRSRAFASPAESRTVGDGSTVSKAARGHELAKRVGLDRCGAEAKRAPDLPSEGA